MFKKLLTFCTLVILGFTSFSQTAVDFTATDCSGASHNLFTDLNSGKIVVFVWVMPCGNCISDAKAAYDVVQTFATSQPGRVIYWMADDLGNSSCSTVSSWATTNGIPASNIVLFGNVGNKIDEANYGGSGMPHVVVLGGGNHKVYFNMKNGTNDGTAISAAVSQAIATGISQKSVATESIKLFPNPAKNKITLDCSSLTSTISEIEIFNIMGEQVHVMINDNKFMSKGIIEINLPENLPIGNYILNIKSEDEDHSLRFTVIE